MYVHVNGFAVSGISIYLVPYNPLALSLLIEVVSPLRTGSRRMSSNLSGLEPSRRTGHRREISSRTRFPLSFIYEGPFPQVSGKPLPSPKGKNKWKIWNVSSSAGYKINTWEGQSQSVVSSKWRPNSNSVSHLQFLRLWQILTDSKVFQATKAMG